MISDDWFAGKFLSIRWNCSRIWNWFGFKGGGIHHNVISYRFFLSIDCFFLFVFFWVSNQTKKNGRGRFFFFLFLFFLFPREIRRKKKKKTNKPSKKKKEKILKKKKQTNTKPVRVRWTQFLFFFYFFLNFSFFKKNWFFFLSRSIGSPIRSNKNSVKLGKKKDEKTTLLKTLR